MTTKHNRAHRHAADIAPRARYCSLSDSESSSSSSSNQTTTNVDKRLVGGEGSIGISGDNSSVTLVDAGAVSASFGFAREALKNAIQVAASSATETADTATAALDKVKDAYSEAKAGEQKVLVGVGVIVVGVIAVAALRGGFK